MALQAEIENDQLDILDKFPLLVPMRKDFTYYEGSIEVKGQLMSGIRLGVPKYPSLEGLWMRCPWAVSYVLRESRDHLKFYINSSKNLFQFLTSVNHLMEERLEDPIIKLLFQSTRRPDSHVYEQLLTDLESVGLDNVSHVSTSLSEVRLHVEDGAGRLHHMTLAPQPKGLYQVNAELPLKAVIEQMPRNTSMATYYRAFKERVDELQLLFDALDDIDNSCWVVDPEVPNRSHVHRRIIVGTNASVQVTLDPVNGSYKPDIKVQGSPSVVERLTDALAAYNLEDWSFECSVVSNLLDALGLECFPCKPETQPDAHLQLVRVEECAICFLYKNDEEKLPDEACDNPKCNITFHQDCLFQWLDALKKPSVYKRMHGECPKCQSKISCEIPKGR